MNKMCINDIKKLGEGYTMLKVLASVLDKDNSKLYGEVIDDTLDTIYVDCEDISCVGYLDLYVADDMYRDDSSCYISPWYPASASMYRDTLYDLSDIFKINSELDALESLVDTYKLTDDTCTKLCVLHSIVTYKLREKDEAVYELTAGQVLQSLRDFDCHYKLQGKAFAFKYFNELVNNRVVLRKVTDLLNLDPVF